MALDTSSWSAAWRDDHELVAVLEDSRRLGFLGPGPIDAHVEHALVMGRVCGSSAGGSALDLGSGGGLPGLVLARLGLARDWVLLDSQQRRVEFLRGAVDRLGLTERVDVLRARAEEAGRAPQHRERYDVVTARSFGAPAVTAECGSGLLRRGGRLVVSEPPSSVATDRWPATPLLDMALRHEAVKVQGFSFALLEKIDSTPDWVPRRVGRPGKRPYF